jgi:hypothetical protein
MKLSPAFARLSTAQREETLPKGGSKEASESE